MRLTPFILCSLLLLTSCATSEQFNANTTNANMRAESVAGAPQAASSATNSMPGVTNVAAQTPDAATPRRIIRDANLTLELDDPATAARRIAAIAEESGGFVTSNEARRIGDEDDAPQSNLVRVNIVIRVPAERFNQILDRIRELGARVTAEKVTGQDVTEEYVDLEARIRAKQALEAQFLEIMRSARTVTDALAVQRQLGDVRTEIEQLEGRRRYLENRTTLSTITVTLEPPAPLVATRPGTFFGDLARAFGGGLDAAATVILVLVRVIIALIPFALLVVLPIVMLWRFFNRRARRRAAAANYSTDATPHETPHER